VNTSGFIFINSGLGGFIFLSIKMPSYLLLLTEVGFFVRPRYHISVAVMSFLVSLDL
jgi:hypothetical protein